MTAEHASKTVRLRPAGRADRVAARGAARSPRACSWWAEDFRDLLVEDLPSLLRPGDVLVVNDAKVIPAQLFGARRRGAAVARIEATLHKKVDAAHWRAFVRPAKKLAIGERIVFSGSPRARVCLAGEFWAQVEEKSEGEVLLGFNLSGPALDDAIMAFGHMPLPPYIAARRAEDARDARDYQTVFAEKPGAVAAPTAGLHFTPTLLDAVRKAGASVEKVTLLVGRRDVFAGQGRGYARPCDARRMGRDRRGMRGAAQCGAGGGRADRGGGHHRAAHPRKRRGRDGGIRPFAGETAIFITPGYRFRAVDALMTNFHLPRSTLFMLVCAFSGIERMQAAYAHAIAAGYRFYSYGDACFLTRGG